MGKICARYCIFVCLFKADRSIGAQHNVVQQMAALVLILLTCNNCMCYALFNANIKYALVEANELRCLQHDIGGYMFSICVKVIKTSSVSVSNVSRVDEQIGVAKGTFLHKSCGNTSI